MRHGYSFASINKLPHLRILWSTKCHKWCALNAYLASELIPHMSIHCVLRKLRDYQCHILVAVLRLSRSTVTFPLDGTDR